MPRGGYAGRILRVDLSSGQVSDEPTDLYSDDFVGGRGIAAKIYWDEVPPHIDAFSPDNRLIIMTGPLTGVPGFGGRFQVCGKSALTNRFSFCNLGGSWGARLKETGYDGIVIQGKAERPVYLRVDHDNVEIRDASFLKGRTAFYTEEKLKETLREPLWVLAIGPAGENRVVFATFLASDNSTGGGGLAAVMGDKNLKAIAIKGGNRKIPVADRQRLAAVRARISDLRRDLPESMASMGMIPSPVLKKTYCNGCPSGCLRAGYEKHDGAKRKFMCQAALFYITRALRYYGEETNVPFEATELCDDYGLDTRSTETMIMWLSRCHRNGILTEEKTGIPLSRIGSEEFIRTMVEKISFREGFGDLLAGGTLKAAERLEHEAQAQIKDYMARTGENAVYGPRLYITTGIFYAVEPRLPIQQLHEVSIPALAWALRVQGIKDIFVNSDVLREMAKRFYGTEAAVDYSTYEGKAQAAARIQERAYAKESLILCDLCWPIYFSKTTPDGAGDPSVESQAYSAVTGRDLDEQGLYKVGERVLNLQRAILVREGHRGREHDLLDEFEYTTPLKGDFGNPDCIVPGKKGEVFSRLNLVVDREEFEKMKDDFYRLRGWDAASGFQTKARLKDLGLEDIAGVLAEDGLVR
ncbi:MAG: hypothetical protein IBX68_09305 [Dehalococcoidia bacterium]|nr:hypothetical protein [Dehalococcoidia bacterium]